MPSLARSTAIGAIAIAAVNVAIVLIGSPVLADAPATTTGEPVGPVQVALVTAGAIAASSFGRWAAARTLGRTRGRTVHLVVVVLVGVGSLGSPFVGLDTDGLGAPLVLAALHLTTTVAAIVVAEVGTRPTWGWGAEPWVARDLEPGATVLVHGATSGIGRATALALLARGVDVIATGRSRERADTLVAAAERLPGQLLTEVGDVTRLRDAADLGARVAERVPWLDGVVHTAGTLDPAGGETADGIDRNLAVSWLSRVALHRQLQLAPGSRTIVVAATTAGARPPRRAIAPRRAADLATGMAAHGQAQLGNDVWAGWLRRLGERATSYGPGSVDTDIRRELPGIARVLRPLFWWSTRTPSDTAQDVVRLLLDRDLPAVAFADRDGPFEHTGPATDPVVQDDVAAVVDEVLTATAPQRGGAGT